MFKKVVFSASVAFSELLFVEGHGHWWNVYLVSRALFFDNFNK